MLPKAQNKINSVIDSLTELGRKSKYFLEEDFEWRRLVHEIKPLQAQVRYQWDCAMGLLLSFVMRFDESDKHFQNSIALSRHPVAVANYIQSVIASGRFLKAQELFREFGAPNQGMFQAVFPMAARCGAYETALRFLREATSMGVNVESSLLDMQALVSFLEAHHLSETDIAHHLDAAGAVMLRHRIRPMAKTIFSSDLEGDSTDMLSILYVAPGGAEDVFALNMELSIEEEARGVKKDISFDVAFVTDVPSNTFENGEMFTLVEG